MAPNDTYLGLRSAFGKIIAVEPYLYNPTATVEARDGTISCHKLPMLIAFGLRKDPQDDRSAHAPA